MIDLDSLDELGEPHEYRECYIISIPICDACKHLKSYERGERQCHLKGKVNLNELQSEGCIDLNIKCKDFEADKESDLYELLMEHVEEAKKRIKK